MKIYAFFSLILIFFTLGICKTDIPTRYQVTLAVPTGYIDGFSGKAYLMETEQMPLNFRTALSVDATDGKYSCSLDVFLGNTRVWDSGHRSMFYTTEVCVLELTEHGDLRLKGPNEQVGWRTGTTEQGVEKLQLLDTGNLVLVDSRGKVKWQTFNFPTDVLLLSQRLSVATHLTAFPRNSTSFFSLEIQYDKLALYLNSGKDKYSYWEFQPFKGRNITFVELTSRGLELFDDKFQNFAQILSPPRLQPVRFLALENITGNLGLYYFSPYNDKFEASFQVLNSTCDLPLTCSPYGICTFSSSCSCIRSLTSNENSNPDCGSRITSGICGKDQAQMLELEDTGSVLRSGSVTVNISKRACADSCLNDCECAAAMYSVSGTSGMDIEECVLYDVVQGVKQVKKNSGMSYLVKVQKGKSGDHKRNGLKKWEMILIVVVDGLILLLVVGGIGYYMIWKRRKRARDGTSS